MDECPEGRRVFEGIATRKPSPERRSILQGGFGQLLAKREMPVSQHALG